MPSTEVEELHLQPQLFSLQCPSVHLLNEPNTYEKNLKLVLVVLKWFLCINILHHVFSVRHIITSHLQPINSAWMAFLSFFSFSTQYFLGGGESKKDTVCCKSTRETLCPGNFVYYQKWPPGFHPGWKMDFVSTMQTAAEHSRGGNQEPGLCLRLVQIHSTKPTFTWSTL